MSNQNPTRLERLRDISPTDVPQKQTRLEKIRNIDVEEESEESYIEGLVAAGMHGLVTSVTRIADLLYRDCSLFSNTRTSFYECSEKGRKWR